VLPLVYATIAILSGVYLGLISICASLPTFNISLNLIHLLSLLTWLPKDFKNSTISNFALSIFKAMGNESASPVVTTLVTPTLSIIFLILLL